MRIDIRCLTMRPRKATLRLHVEQAGDNVTVLVSNFMYLIEKLWVEVTLAFPISH